MARARLARARLARAVLASFTLAGTLFVAAGCHHHDLCDGHGGGWFSRFRTASRVHDCDCVQTPVVTSTPGPVLVQPDPVVQPGPIFTPGAPQPVPPRIVPVPQANPMPYSPQ